MIALVAGETDAAVPDLLGRHVYERDVVERAADAHAARADVAVDGFAGHAFEGFPARLEPPLPEQETATHRVRLGRHSDVRPMASPDKQHDRDKHENARIGERDRRRRQGVEQPDNGARGEVAEALNGREQPER